MVPDSPPPTYEEALASGAQPQWENLYVPPRYQAPTEGRNSIVYSQLAPLYDTTRLYLIDNKSADIAAFNYQNDHSDYLTSVVQNSDFTPTEASTQTINFDERSRWGGDFRSLLHLNIPNVTEYMFSNSFSVKVMTAYDSATQQGTYSWVTLTIPEGNYPDYKVWDLMNNAVVENYLAVGRQNGVKEEQIGVKFDSRNFRLGYDPETGLCMPGSYTYEAVHPDIVLLPGCGVDFTQSRLNNLLGIRKRLPFQEGFKIEYEDLVGGNIPALLDVDTYQLNGQIQALTQDADGRSYHVGEDPSVAATYTAYRSWYVAYNYGPAEGVRSKTLLTAPDVTCGVEQLYWSLPDMTVPPVTFNTNKKNPANYPVVGTELLPLVSRSYFNATSVYSQYVNETTNQTHVFNRFPKNQILVQPPAPIITCLSENVPVQTNHGTLPLKNSIPGVQRVTVTDARRRVCPYVYKSLGVVTPRVLSSRTL